MEINQFINIMKTFISVVVFDTPFFHFTKKGLQINFSYIKTDENSLLNYCVIPFSYGD